MIQQPTSKRRGAAALETTLGILVLIPVLLYGIHFAELGIVQMKVVEAGAAPLWDATAYPMHITGFPSSYAPMLRNAVESSRISANVRYGVNFDGRMSALQTNRTGRFGSIPLIQYGQFLTGAGLLSVRCQTDPAAPGNRLEFDPAFVNTVLKDNGGMSCYAQAVAFNILPDSFFETAQGGLFQASMKEGTASRTATGLCSTGRPRGLNGDCGGTFAMMMDDWGLANQMMEAEICSLTAAGAPCENINYYAATKALYELATVVQTAASFVAPHRLFVSSVIGFTPPLMRTDTSFYMSFTGEDLGFMMFVPAGGGDFHVWQTTPYVFPTTYLASHLMRHKCYLGYGGC